MPHPSRTPAAGKPCRALLALGIVTCSSVCASPVLIIRSSDSVSDGPTVQAVANLSALHVAAGNTVTVAVDLPPSLDGYSQVWDLGFRLRLDDAMRGDYLSYLQQGGRLAVFGENGTVFGNRNGDVRQLIGDVGGGAVGLQASVGFAPQTVRAPFTAPGTVGAVTLMAAGVFDGHGNGDWALALADDSLGSGLYFDPGDLMNAPAGTLLSVLDIDFLGNLSGQFAGAGGVLASNMVATLTNGVSVQVPEPPVVALVLLALVIMGLRARGRPSSTRDGQDTAVVAA